MPFSSSASPSSCSTARPASCWPPCAWDMRLSASSPPAYGLADRLLHRVALARPVLELTFDLERASFSKQASGQEAAAPVFVCGLARAGTSITVRLLDAAGEFAS